MSHAMKYFPGRLGAENEWMHLVAAPGGVMFQMAVRSQSQVSTLRFSSTTWWLKARLADRSPQFGAQNNDPVLRRLTSAIIS
jgi:hypothetical protein